jgi:hypothetical protein
MVIAGMTVFLNTKINIFLALLLHGFVAYICFMNQLMNIFLSFYLLLLACMPCHDVVESTGKTEQTIVRSDTDSKADHGTDSDFCSPLCSCACCGTIMISPYAARISVFMARTVQVKFPNETKDTANFISLLWQPPQLV